MGTRRLWVDSVRRRKRRIRCILDFSVLYRQLEPTRDGRTDIMWGATTRLHTGDIEYGGGKIPGRRKCQMDRHRYHQDGDKNLSYHQVTANRSSWKWQLQRLVELWHYKWTKVQRCHIGQSRFRSRRRTCIQTIARRTRWYLFVDDLPTPGYQPMVSTNLDEGWDYLDHPIISY